MLDLRLGIHRPRQQRQRTPKPDLGWRPRWRWKRLTRPRSRRATGVDNHVCQEVRHDAPRHPDNESVTNPNDPCHREWGSGGGHGTIDAIVIMVGIIAYGATTATKTPPNSTALHHRTTGQAHTGT